MKESSKKKQSELTEYISESDKRYLMEQGKKIEFKKDAYLFHKGDVGDSIYIIQSGAVIISIHAESGQEIILSRLGEGDIFGEIGMFDQKERTAGAYASTSAKLVSIDRERFLELMVKRPTLYRSVIILLCERLRWFSDCVEDFALCGSLERLVARLVHLAQHSGQKETAVVDVSQDELAKMVGLTREMVNKNLSILRKKNFIKPRRKKIIIPDVERLASFCKGEEY